MKLLRILLVFSLSSFASVALVRAEGQCGKKADSACGGGVCPAEKKQDKKCDKDDSCAQGSCAKPEKKDEKKAD